MKNFSHIWMYCIFILQVIGFGINLGKLGEEKKGAYGSGELLSILIFCILSGFAIYWWPHEA